MSELMVFILLSFLLIAGLFAAAIIRGDLNVHVRITFHGGLEIWMSWRGEPILSPSPEPINLFPEILQDGFARITTRFQRPKPRDSEVVGFLSEISTNLHDGDEFEYFDRHNPRPKESRLP